MYQKVYSREINFVMKLISLNGLSFLSKAAWPDIMQEAWIFLQEWEVEHNAPLTLPEDGSPLPRKLFQEFARAVGRYFYRFARCNGFRKRKVDGVWFHDVCGPIREW